MQYVTNMTDKVTCV